MALPNYGVVIGTFNRFEREPTDNFGKWYHGFVFVNAVQRVYRCAVDVYKPDGGFQYMLLGLNRELFSPILSLADGYHELPTNASSGAVDYIRSPMVNQAKGCLALIYVFINAIFGTSRNVWIENTGDNALNSLRDLASGARRLYVFGAPFHDERTGEFGMHDVHMNQGDPPGSFQHLDGIWQDGCVIVEKEDGKLSGYFGKFVTQSLHTDDNGLPV